MLVTCIVVIVRNHFVRLALETHTLVAPAASDPEAAVNSIHRNLAFFVGALANIVLEHILLENLIATKSSLLASHNRVISHLSSQKFTLHSMQKTPRQTSHSI